MSTRTVRTVGGLSNLVWYCRFLPSTFFYRASMTGNSSGHWPLRRFCRCQHMQCQNRRKTQRSTYFKMSQHLRGHHNLSWSPNSTPGTDFGVQHVLIDLNIQEVITTCHDIQSQHQGLTLASTYSKRFQHSRGHHNVKIIGSFKYPPISPPSLLLLPYSLHILLRFVHVAVSACSNSLHIHITPSES